MARASKIDHPAVLAMHAKGMLAKEIAERIGVSRSRIWQICHAERPAPAAVQTDTYRMSVVPASSVPREKAKRRGKYSDIIDAVRQLGDGEALRIEYPGQVRRREWQSSIRHALAEEGIRVACRSDAHYLYLVRKEARAGP
jgi:transcriptional regulator with XRE-family HTH domain